MQNAMFRQPLPDRFKPHISQGYERASQDAQPFEIVGVTPAGALSVSGADIAKFMIAHLQKGASGSSRILQESTARV